jgi:hypothetical protein
VLPANVAVAWSQLRFHFASLLGNIGSGFRKSVKAGALCVNTPAAIPTTLVIKLRLETIKYLLSFFIGGPADRVCARDLADAVGFCDISGQIEYLTRYTAAGISEIRRVGYVEGFQPLLNRIRVNPAANGFGSVEWKDYGGCRVRWDADGKAMLALLPIGDDGSVFRVILHV